MGDISIHNKIFVTLTMKIYDYNTCFMRLMARKIFPARFYAETRELAGKILRTLHFAKRSYWKKCKLANEGRPYCVLKK